MSDTQAKARRDALGRRSFLQSAGLGGMALLSGSAGWPAPASAAGRGRQPATLPIEHVIISCQENRSFDHYFGFAPQVQAAGFGPPAGYSQPDGNGGAVVPFEFTALSTDDIGHSWSDVHGEWNAGAMDGFFTTDGNAAMGYYTARELPFYYSLLDEFTLCGNYFCSLLGPTWPNRFYFAAGTSGGITTNGVWGYGVFDYPIILDLLDAAGVSWKVYNNRWDSVPVGNTDNVFLFWKRFAHDKRTHGTRGDFFGDLKHGTLPQVSSDHPEFREGPGRASAGRRLRGDGDSGGLHHRAQAIADLGADPRFCSRMTSTADTSTTWPLRSSTHSDWGFGCRCGSCRRWRNARTSKRRCTSTRPP